MTGKLGRSVDLVSPNTLPKTNLEPKKGLLKEDSSLRKARFQVPC